MKFAHRSSYPILILVLAACGTSDKLEATLSTAATGERATLRSTLQDSSAVEAPLIGPAGNDQWVYYLSGYSGNGVAMTPDSGGALSFPGSVIDQNAGSLELWIRPNNAPSDDATVRTVFAVGSAGSSPILQLSESDALRFSISTDQGVIEAAAAPDAEVWQRWSWSRLRAEWDSRNESDSLRVFVNGARVEMSLVPGGWSMSSLANARLYVATSNDRGDDALDAVIDELAVFKASSATPAPSHDAGFPDARPVDSGSPDAAPAPRDAGTPAPQDAGTPTRPPPSSSSRNLGTNMDAVTYWTTAPIFADVMKQSMPWLSGTTSIWSDGRSLDLDADGNVRSLASGQVAHTIVFAHQGQAPGDYQLLWDGDASFDVSGWEVVSSGAGQMVLRSDGSTAANIDLVRVGTPYPRSIRLMTPGAIAGNRWNPAYLASLREYRALRFMDWQRTNDDIAPTWAGRPLPSNQRYSDKLGPPIEVMVDLANQSGTDPWFNIHHRADDSYVRQMARLVCTSLQPGLKVYVEHSNEVWNGTFMVYNFAVDQGRALGLSSDEFLAGQYYHTLRSAQIAAIWVSECGAERVVRVLATQAANGDAWIGRVSLDFAAARGYSFDAVAIAPYFGGDIVPAEASSVNNVFSLLSSRSLPRAISWMTAYRLLADAYGVKVIAYEGGQHVVDFGNVNSSVDAVMDAVNRDPRMGQLYTQYLEAWAQQIGGGNVFSHYHDLGRWDHNGRWGARQTLWETRAQSPKYDALLRYLGR